MQKAVIMGVFAEVFVWENENIGLLCVKVPMFCMKSTALFGEEVRCFCLFCGVFDASQGVFSCVSPSGMHEKCGYSIK